MDNTQELIDKLTNAISFKFKEDATSPGLTISRLRRGFYCSVVRYPKGAATAKNKVVVCKAEAADLDSAIKSVALAFLIALNHRPDPIQELAELASLPKVKND